VAQRRNAGYTARGIPEFKPPPGPPLELSATPSALAFADGALAAAPSARFAGLAHAASGGAGAQLARNLSSRGACAHAHACATQLAAAQMHVSDTQSSAGQTRLDRLSILLSADRQLDGAEAHEAPLPEAASALVADALGVFNLEELLAALPQADSATAEADADALVALTPAELAHMSVILDRVMQC
jgi:hypothetical protein